MLYDKELISKKLVSGNSLMEISEECGYSYFNLYYWCKKNEMPVSRKNNGKSKKSRIFLESQHKLSSDDVEMVEKLKHMYLVQNMSVYDIAPHFDVSGATIATTLRRCGISVKLFNGRFELRRPAYTRNELYNLYITQQLSLVEISNVLDYKHYGGVVEDLKYYNIPRRTYSEAGDALYKKHPEKCDLHRDQLYAGITGKRFNDVTDLEQRFMDWAKENNLEYTFQFQIHPKWHRYDFRIIGTNIIVEMDGDMWHSTDEHKKRPHGK